MTPDSLIPATLNGPPAPTVGQRARRTASLIWRVVSVRLRFLAIVGLGFGVVAEWDVLRNHWDKLTRPDGRPDPSQQAVSSDTEYFCPMDPGIVADWPGKCGVCNMGLVRRKRGDATPLPEGVVARMQFSPYRLQLGGIRTTPVAYQPLARTVEAPGRVSRVEDSHAEIEAEVLGVDGAILGEVSETELITDAPAATFRAKVVSRTAGDGQVVLRLRAEESPKGLRVEQPVRVRMRCPIAQSEPFRSQPPEPALRKGEPRHVFVCPEHAETIRERAARCPIDDLPLDRRDLATNQRVRWWCPMHPDVIADEAGKVCQACNGMTLVPRILSYAPPGQVLAVPESAVVDTGARKVVYVERMTGMFDGVEVVLGPRCVDAYPVIRGLGAGDRVATAGSFLIDAETRLNPSLAAGYFGAGRRPDRVDRPLPSAKSGDTALVAGQKNCPVTGNPLGSMGPPVRIEVAARVVFLCCDGCEDAIRANPAKYFAKLPSGERRDP